MNNFEVICMRAYPEDKMDKEYLAQVKMKAPAPGEIFNVIGGYDRGDKSFFQLSGYPPGIDPKGFYNVMFNASYFENISHLQPAIEQALKADLPKRVYLTAEEEFTYTGRLTRSYIEQLDYNNNPDLSIMQTRTMINSCRIVLQSTRDPFKQALALAQVDALEKHLADLHDKFNRF